MIVWANRLVEKNHVIIQIVGYVIPMAIALLCLKFNIVGPNNAFPFCLTDFAYHYLVFFIPNGVLIFPAIILHFYTGLYIFRTSKSAAAKHKERIMILMRFIHISLQKICNYINFLSLNKAAVACGSFDFCFRHGLVDLHGQC